MLESKKKKSGSRTFFVFVGFFVAQHPHPSLFFFFRLHPLICLPTFLSFFLSFKVYRGVRKSDGRPVAIKEISKAAGNLIELRGEHTTMAHLQPHKNVVELLDFFEDRAFVHIVMEMCQGDMWTLIQNRHEKYSEADAAEMLKQIVRVVAHGHSLGVIHRDLKPDNFLVGLDGKTLKCTDFGFAVICPVLEYRDKGPLGTTEYLPPEAFRGVYSDKSDIWACGIILYILLSGLFPFPDRHAIKSERAVYFPTKEFANISAEAKDLVCKMLHKDRHHRINAQQVLDHPWMTKGARSEPLGDALLHRFNQFSKLDKFKKAAMHIIARTADPDEIEGLYNMFESMDENHDGSITITEMRNAFKRRKSEVSDADLQRLMEAGDADGNGVLNYDEFLAATISVARLRKPEEMSRLFRQFDLDGDGFVTLDELYQVLKAQGGTMDDARAQMAILDRDKNGVVDYSEFQAYMLSHSGRMSSGLAGALNSTS